MQQVFTTCRVEHLDSFRASRLRIKRCTLAACLIVLATFQRPRSNLERPSNSHWSLLHIDSQLTELSTLHLFAFAAPLALLPPCMGCPQASLIVGGLSRPRGRLCAPSGASHMVTCAWYLKADFAFLSSSCLYHHVWGMPMLLSTSAAYPDQGDALTRTPTRSTRCCWPYIGLSSLASCSHSAFEAPGRQ